MRKPLSILAAVAGLVIVRNFENLLDATGAATLLEKAPGFLLVIDAVLLQKWVLAGATLIVGLWAGDLLVRRSLVFELRRDSLPLAWLSHRVRSIRWALRFPRTCGRILDVPFELATLERSLGHHGFPPLPTIDPASPSIADSLDYLIIVGTIDQTSIEGARKRAKALTDALLPAPSPTPPPPTSGRGLRAAFRRLTIGSRTR